MGIWNGWDIFVATLKTFSKYPAFNVPLLICWLVYAPTAIYLKYFLPYGALSGWQIAGIIVLVFVGFSLIISLTCLLLLEFIEQIETTGRVRVASAIGRVIWNDFLPSVPVAAIWAAIWLGLTLIEVAISSVTRNSGRRQSFSMEGAAKTLSGYQSFSLSAAFFEALNRGVRMLAFLIFPAIAWEHDNTIKALKRGLSIAEAHKGELGAGVLLITAAAGLVFLPPSILFYVTDKTHTTLPDSVWLGVIIYCGFAWSFTILMEQLFTATLYRWHLDWEQRCRDASRHGLPEPRLNEVLCLAIMDHAAEFFH